MKLSLAILSLAAMGLALPIQQAATKENNRQGLGTAIKIGGGIAKGLFGAFAK
ncbi:hypothetical protein FVEN_g13169 [Fusarium venenatum]|uniref:Uncharacterized protein n=1 Tax=Fusarium venenatum TaxID=56646 RepID=A0A2L2TZR1_9HYPO|nr:uncharacterized protein FVRRES_08037 [Fusarium venenatum]KAG8354315.1 hypothetical protein FVEN_g13169 [Fusarium venenatum]CEI67960.1 unnamed protein product [Fusarium venenatum]